MASLRQLHGDGAAARVAAVSQRLEQCRSQCSEELEVYVKQLSAECVSGVDLSLRMRGVLSQSSFVVAPAELSVRQGRGAVIAGLMQELCM